MARPKKPKPPAEKLTRDEGIKRTVKLLQEATEIGRPLTSPTVMNALGVSKPTALSYIRAATLQMAADGAAAVADARLEQGESAAIATQPLPPRRSLDREEALAVGVDMAGTLAMVKGNLEQTHAALQADLDFVRWVVLGGPAAESIPTRCPECNKRQLARFAGAAVSPHLMGPNALPAFGKLYSELIKALKAITEVVGEQNDVLEQFYNFAQVQRFMAHTEQAIREKCDPELAKAIARRIRELGAEG